MSIQLQRFIPIQPPPVDYSPFSVGCKHVNGCYLPLQKKIIVGGGDVNLTYASNSGNQTFWYYQPLTNTWSIAAGYCGPAGTVTAGAVEEGPIAWDPKRSLMWANSGAGNISGDHACTTVPPAGQSWQTGSQTRYGTVTFDPSVASTNAWAVILDINNQLIRGAWWDYDPVKDELVTAVGDHITHFSMASPSNSNPLNRTKAYPPTFGAGGAPYFFDGANGYGSPDMSASKQVMDVLGRCCYFLIPTAFYQNYNSIYGSVRFWKYDLDTMVFTKLPDPPNANQAYATETMPIWDSRNRALVWFQRAAYTSPGPPANTGWSGSQGDGNIYGVYVYDTTLSPPAWVDCSGPLGNFTSNGIGYPPSPQTFVLCTDTNGGPVCGNVHLYDPINNVFVIGGQANVSLAASPNKFFLWRYK